MSPEKLREHLWKLPAAERLSMLMGTCAELVPNALGAVLSIIEVEERWASSLRRITRAFWRDGIGWLRTGTSIANRARRLKRTARGALLSSGEFILRSASTGPRGSLYGLGRRAVREFLGGCHWRSSSRRALSLSRTASLCRTHASCVHTPSYLM